MLLKKRVLNLMGLLVQLKKSDVLHGVGRRLHIIGEILHEKVMESTPDVELNSRVYNDETLSLKDKEFLQKRLKDESLVHSQVGLIEAGMYQGVTLEQLNLLLNPTLLEVENDNYHKANELMQICFTNEEIGSIPNGYFLQDKLKNVIPEQ